MPAQIASDAIGANHLHNFGYVGCRSSAAMRLAAVAVPDGGGGGGGAPSSIATNARLMALGAGLSAVHCAASSVPNEAGNCCFSRSTISGGGGRTALGRCGYR